MQYNDLVYKTGPTNVNDYISNKYNIIHNMLYEDALSNYLHSYIHDVIFKELLYTLFVCMNNCITSYNDNNDIVNLSLLDSLKQNDPYKIFTLSEINNNNLLRKPYFDSLLMYIEFHTNYKKQINNVFKSLNVLAQRDDYLKYIIVNVISLMETLKNNISIIANVSKNQFSDFIIRYNNSLYMINEYNEITFINTELSNNEIFIYEEQYKLDFHIGFNKDGYFILDIDPTISFDVFANYDKLYYIISYINNQLLELMFNQIKTQFSKTNTIIEKPQDEYFLPSSIIIYQDAYPHKKTIVDLAPYWSDYQDHSNIDFANKKIIDEEIKDAKVEDIDYVKGKVKLYSKMHDIEYTVDAKYVGENTEINDELIENTFVQKLRNISD